MTIKFTSCQEEAIPALIKFIESGFDPNKYIMGLSGAGGTGKTFSIDYVMTNARVSNSVIGLTTPTHKACRVLSSSLSSKKGAITIQSMFGFRLDMDVENFDPKNPQFNPRAKPKIDGINTLIIDEASMLNAHLVNYILKTCRNKSIKIIFIGDTSQLSPVGEKQSTAFKYCNKVFELKTIVRQNITNPISNLLSILRKDIKDKTYNFLTHISMNKEEVNDIGEGFKVVSNKHEFMSIMHNHFMDEEYTKDINKYRVVAFTNAAVTRWNNYIRNLIVTNADKSCITKNDLMMSYITIVNEFNEGIIYNSEEYIIHEIVDMVENKYGLKGFMVRFQCIFGGEITKPLFVIDHTDALSINKYNEVITNLIKEAKNARYGVASKWKAFYDFKNAHLLATNIIGNDGKIIHSRNLDYGFAITSHKSQGSTYKTVFVDLVDMLYDSKGKAYSGIDDILRRIYVACSRAKVKLIIYYK